MDERYHEIRESLRKSHFQNTREVYQRERSPIYQYNYSGRQYVQDENMNQTSWTFFLRGKFVFMIIFVLIFSCYLYGGKDIQKGADMAITELKNSIFAVEEKYPQVQETISVLRETYRNVCDFAEEYTVLDE